VIAKKCELVAAIQLALCDVFGCDAKRWSGACAEWSSSLAFAIQVRTSGGVPEAATGYENALKLRKLGRTLWTCCGDDIAPLTQAIVEINTAGCIS